MIADGYGKWYNIQSKHERRKAHAEAGGRRNGVFDCILRGRRMLTCAVEKSIE